MNQYQITCAQDFFEGVLRKKIEDASIMLTTDAHVALGRLLKIYGVRLTCQRIRVQLEETRCRDLSVAILGLD